MKTRARLIAVILLISTTLMFVVFPVQAKSAKGEMIEKVGSVLLKAGEYFLPSILDLIFARPSAEITNISIVHNQRYGAVYSMAIYIDFIVNHRKGEICDLNAYFYDVNRNPLRDYNGWFAAPNRQVATGWRFIPTYEAEHYNNVILYLPYIDLHLAPGRYYLNFIIQIQSKGKLLKESAPQDFMFAYN